MVESVVTKERTSEMVDPRVGDATVKLAAEPAAEPSTEPGMDRAATKSLGVASADAHRPDGEAGASAPHTVSASPDSRSARGVRGRNGEASQRECPNRQDQPKPLKKIATSLRHR
jgi:hypothetical protein